jgi:hypothetical protein
MHSIWMLHKRPAIVRSFSYSKRVPASAARRHLPARPHAVILSRPRRRGAAHAARERCAGGGGRPGEMPVVLRTSGVRGETAPEGRPHARSSTHRYAWERARRRATGRRRRTRRGARASRPVLRARRDRPPRWAGTPSRSRTRCGRWAHRSPPYRRAGCRRPVPQSVLGTIGRRMLFTAEYEQATSPRPSASAIIETPSARIGAAYVHLSTSGQPPKRAAPTHAYPSCAVGGQTWVRPRTR